jgi:hypothetical protein
MKFIKKYENWKNNSIDHTLFKSGKAKYNPHVSNGSIKYKTGNKLPYYHAEIKEKGDRFICKIYKKDENGDDVRLRNKVKKDLKLAHNYVREFLNQKLKRDEKNKNKSKSKKDSIEKIIREEPNYVEDRRPIEPIKIPKIEKPKKKTIIRRF